MSEKKIREPMQRRIAYAQLAYNHPILKEDRNTQHIYYSTLNHYCKKLLRLSKYGKTVLYYYKTIFNIERVSSYKQRLSTKLRVILLLDILHISGYNRSVISLSTIRNFRFDKTLLAILDGLFANLKYDNVLWDVLKNNKYVQSEAEWIEGVRKNVAFSLKKPYKIMVTATMSAGKSTFINALVGEKVASTKNLACTGRLHYIYSKPFNDGLIGMWDRQIILDAKNSILNDHEETQEKISYESIYYKGGLYGRQCMILDTPGVNSAEYQRHGESTNSAIENSAYDALVFLINYEHIGTVDEINHLAFIKQKVSENTPVLFCVNKIDSKKRDDMPLEEKICDVTTYLNEHGFSNAPVFFVSSRAAYLYRVREWLQDEDEIDDLDSITKKIIRSANITSLYNAVKPIYIDQSNDSFEYQCGIGYIEDYIIKLMLEKGKE